MTISAIPGNSISNPAASAAGSNSNSSSNASIGDQLLAALAQSEATNGTSTDPLFSYIVALNSPQGAAGGTAAASTYNAQGLLAQTQSDMLMNDALLSPASTDPSNPMDGLFAMPGTSSLVDPLTGASVAPAATASTASGAAASSAGSPTLANLMQSNPGLAATLENSQIEQQFYSMLP
jgi:hypothetical protein